MSRQNFPSSPGLSAGWNTVSRHTQPARIAVIRIKKTATIAINNSTKLPSTHPQLLNNNEQTIINTNKYKGIIIRHNSRVDLNNNKQNSQMINHKESIDALRKIKRNNGDLSPTREFKENKLRSDFKFGLSKLIHNETREQGIKELKSLISLNQTSVNLRIWLSVLSENREKSFEGEALIIGFILNQYKKNLIDPIDKIPSLDKTIFRVIEILRKFFKDDTLPIQMACQKSWLQIYKSCLEGESTEIKKRLVYDTLEAMINGGADKQSQVTAQIIIDGLLETALAKEDNEFFREIAKPTLVLFLKTYIAHPATLTALQTILSFFKLSNLQPIAESIIDKIIFYINNSAQNSLGYKIKSQGCNLLGMMGTQDVGLQLQEKIMTVLEAMSTDRIWAVQMAARKAYDIWKKKKSQLERVEAEKRVKVKELDELKNSIESLYMESRGKEAFEAEKNKSKIETSSPVFVEKEKEKSFEKNVESQKAAFLKKGDGSGGGYFHAQKGQQKFSYEPEHRRISGIKNQILENKHKTQSEIIDFEETVPYDVEEIKNFRSETAPENFNKKKPVRQAPIPVSAPELDEQQQTLLDNWQRVLILYESNQLQNAYKLILQMDDDIYLIRLLIKTGPILDKLTRPTSTRLLKKLLQIMKSDFLNQMFLTSVEGAIKSNVPNILDNKQNKSIADTMTIIAQDPKYNKHVKRLKQSHENSLSNTR